MIITISKMTPAEKIAEDTWDRIKQSWDLNVRLGEETLTELLTLDFTRLAPGHSKLFQTTKKKESQQGTDLEIRVHTGGNRARLFAVQAKRLYSSGKYVALNKRKNSLGFSQTDILEKYSKKARAFPLYLLYNYVDLSQISRWYCSCWHCCGCCGDPDKKQLGCTLVPSRDIRPVLSKGEDNNFESIHKSRGAVPWRCLFDCPLRLSTDSGVMSMFCDSLQQPKQLDEMPDYTWVNSEPVAGAWPSWLWSIEDKRLSSGDWYELWTYCKQKPETFPKRLLLIREK